MNIDADRLAKQVKIAYDFIDALHGQALALIKDVETQLAGANEELRCLQPGGYRFAANPLSYGLDRPQAAIADYYGVCFRHFPDRVRNTALDGDVPPICFLKVVLREHDLEHPEARFGLVTDIEKPPERADSFPHKLEELVNDIIMRRALAGPPWCGRAPIAYPYEHSYVRFAIRGRGVRLADLPDSEAIAEEIVEPLLEMYRELSA